MLARKSSGSPPSFASGATVSKQVVLPRTTFSTSLRPCCHRPSSARRLRSQLVRRHLLCVFGLFETRTNAPGPPLPATYPCKVGTRTRIATSRVGSKSVAPAFNRCVASRLILIPIGRGTSFRISNIRLIVHCFRGNRSSRWHCRQSAEFPIESI